MRILVSIDDTDNLESKGTGELASTLASYIEEAGWGSADYVTRHQLLVHPDIPYTSHNSAMAFRAHLSDNCLARFRAHAMTYLERESAPGSDPGLCIVDLDRLLSGRELIGYGALAKKAVLSKEGAYELAHSLEIHLSEHGGTGHGVIGALAGAGLRLGGNDGRLKGQLLIETVEGVASAGQLLEHPSVDVVRSVDGYVLRSDEQVMLHDKVKSVMLNGQSVVLVEQGDSTGLWRNLSRQQLKGY